MKTLSIPIRYTDFQVCFLIIVFSFSSIASEARCKVSNSTRVNCSYRGLTIVPKNLPSSATHLDLSCNHISSFTANSFENLYSLEVLAMWIINDVDIDPDAFVGLKKLRKLIIVTDVKFYVTFGKDAFKHLTSLQELELPIKTFSIMQELPFSGLIDLYKLTIHTPALSYINPILPTPSLFQGLGNLQELSVFGLALENSSSEAFKDLRNLKKVFFKSKDCKDIKNLKPLKKLEIIQIDNLIVKDDCNVTFSYFPLLKKVSLFDVRVFNNAIPIFDFSMNNLSKLNIDIKFLKEWWPTPLRLTSISNLSHLTLYGRGTLNPQTFQHILSSLDNLIVDILSMFGMLDQSDRYNLAETTFKGLAHSNLQELDISNNPLGTIATNSFQWLSKLKTLDIHLCHLVDDSFVSLRGLSILTTLILNYNRLQNFNKLLSLLSPMTSLRSLDAGENMFHGQIPRHVFQKNQALTSINLSGNKFTSIHPHSFIFLSNLQHLDLSDNKLAKLPDRAFHAMHTLSNLLLSGNDLRFPTEVAHYHPLQNLGNLTKLTLTMTSIGPLNINLMDTPYLGSLSIYGSQYSNYMLFQKNVHLEQLRSLLIENVIFPWTDTIGVILNIETLRLKLPQALRVLRLSKNNFNLLNFTSLNELGNLEELYVASNKLSTIHGVPDKLTKLETLDLSENLITVLSSGIFTLLPSLGFLKVYGNPFDCSCKLKPFKDWLIKDRQAIVYSEYFYAEQNACSQPKGKYGVPVDAVELGFECNLAFIVSIPLTCCVIMVAIIVALVTRFHWHIRFAYFFIKLKLGGYQLKNNDVEQPINKQYDAFVVYNQHDSDWVIHELVPHLENIDPPNFKLCIHERDFIPGNDIFENILDSIENSKKTMLILSPHFAASEWCYFEMRMAQSCLFEEKRDIIVMISLKRIPDADMPRILRNILLNKSCLNWPENEMGRRLFWEKLKVALRSDSRVNRVANL